jgi:hypothetical protein
MTSNSKNRAPASTHKKVVVELLDGSAIRGYLPASGLGVANSVDVLTPDGEHRALELEKVRCVYFVREFSEKYQPERKSFLSRPKLEGLWVRVRFPDGEAIEGIIANDLRDLLENGVQLTPPDLHGNALRIFIPRTSCAEVKVMGVVGLARKTGRGAPIPAGQTKLFDE